MVRGHRARRKLSAGGAHHFPTTNTCCAVMLRVKPSLYALARTTAGSGELDRLFVAHIGGPRHASVQGIANVGAGLAFGDGDQHRPVESPPFRGHCGRVQNRAPGQALDPVLQQFHAIVVDGFACERRHPDVTDGIHSHECDRAPDVVRRNDSWSIDALIDQHRPVDQFLLVDGGVVAGVEIRDRPAGPVALRAICVQIRSGPVLQASRCIVRGRERRQLRELRLAHFGREHFQMVPGTNLIVRHSRRVGECAVHLPRLDAEHPAGICVVAFQAIRPARVVPCLIENSSRRRFDRNRFGFAGAQQIRVAAVRPPLVNDAVHSAGAVAYQ